MTRIRFSLLVMPLFVIALSGCVVPQPLSPEGPCERYSTPEELLAKYEGTANESRENYNAVSVGVSSWGMATHERRNETPSLYVDWTMYSRDDRPELFEDVLCASYHNIERFGPPVWHGEVGLKGDRGITVVTSQSAAEAALSQLAVEFERQTSEADGECCYLLFAGYYYGAGWNPIHPTWANEY